jgi:hypothetical protein
MPPASGLYPHILTPVTKHVSHEAHKLVMFMSELANDSKTHYDADFQSLMFWLGSMLKFLVILNAEHSFRFIYLSVQRRSILEIVRAYNSSSSVTGSQRSCAFLQTASYSRIGSHPQSCKNVSRHHKDLQTPHLSNLSFKSLTEEPFPLSHTFSTAIKHDNAQYKFRTDSNFMLMIPQQHEIHLSAVNGQAAQA